MRWSIKKNLWLRDLTFREILFAWGKILLFCAATAWLYYHSLWGLIVVVPLGICYRKLLLADLEKEKKNVFLEQFKMMLQSLSASLGTGYSIENAIIETERELLLLYPEDARILQEVAIMKRQLNLQMPVEHVMTSFAERVDLSDVESFATVFVTAKRSGGDLIRIIKNTSEQIGDKIDVRREIVTILAAKSYELKVMAVIPYAIIGYMYVSFPEFMSCLYGNIMGIGVMSVCLGMYVCAYYLGVKLIEIEV